MYPTPMPPARALVITTEVLLGVLFLVGVAAILLLPSLAGELAVSYPEYADLRVPLLAIATVFTLLGLFAIVVVALLVRRIGIGAMLSRGSVRWVDLLGAALGCAAALVVVGFVVVSIGQAGSPFMALIQVLTCLTLIALACVTRVLRSLLQNAITMRAELDEVV